MIGATMRRRLRQVSPSLMNSPSPISGLSMWRIVGLLRSKLSFLMLNAYCTVSGVLQMKTLRARICVVTKS